MVELKRKLIDTADRSQLVQSGSAVRTDLHVVGKPERTDDTGYRSDKFRKKLRVLVLRVAGVILPSL